MQATDGDPWSAAATGRALLLSVSRTRFFIGGRKKKKKKSTTKGWAGQRATVAAAEGGGKINKIQRMNLWRLVRRTDSSKSNTRVYELVL
jgi:hypothetical protein